MNSTLRSLRSAAILACALLTCVLHAAEIDIEKREFHQHAETLRTELAEMGIRFNESSLTLSAELEALCDRVFKETGNRITPRDLFTGYFQQINDYGALLAAKGIEHVSPAEFVVYLTESLSTTQEKLSILQTTIDEQAEKLAKGKMRDKIGAVFLSGGAVFAPASAYLVLASLYGNCPEDRRAEFRKTIWIGLLQTLSTATYAFTNRNINQREQTLAETVLSQLIFARLFNPHLEKLSTSKIVLLDITSDSLLTMSTKTLESLNNTPVLTGAKILFNDIRSSIVTAIMPTSVPIATQPISEATASIGNTAGRALASSGAQVITFLHNNIIKPCNDNVISPVNEYAVKPAVRLLSPDLRIQGFINPRIEKQESALTKKDYALYVANSTVKYASAPIAKYVIEHTPALAEDRTFAIGDVTVITKHQLLTAITKIATDTACYELLRHLSQNAGKEDADPTKQTRITSGDLAKLTTYNIGIPVASNMLFHLFKKHVSPHLDNKDAISEATNYAFAGIAITVAAPVCVTVAMKTAAAVGRVAIDAASKMFPAN